MEGETRCVVGRLRILLPRYRERDGRNKFIRRRHVRGNYIPNETERHLHMFEHY